MFFFCFFSLGVHFFRFLHLHNILALPLHYNIANPVFFSFVFFPWGVHFFRWKIFTKWNITSSKYFAIISTSGRALLTPYVLRNGLDLVGQLRLKKKTIYIIYWNKQLYQIYLGFCNQLLIHKNMKLDYLITAGAFKNWRSRFSHEITFLTTHNIQTIIEHHTCPTQIVETMTKIIKLKWENIIQTVNRLRKFHYAENYWGI